VKSGVGCMINNQMLNVLAYADDIVLMSPSWRSMQILIDILFSGASEIDMICNTLKNVAMVFNPKIKRWALDVVFPHSNSEMMLLNLSMLLSV